jgi:hypothetical protein
MRWAGLPGAVLGFDGGLVAAPFMPFGDGASRLSRPMAAGFSPFSDGGSKLSGPVARRPLCRLVTVPPALPPGRGAVCSVW